jgi:hypothetical protein
VCEWEVVDRGDDVAGPIADLVLVCAGRAVDLGGIHADVVDPDPLVVVLEGVADHQVHAAHTRGHDHSLGVGHRRGQRFLDEDVLARVAGLESDRGVRGGRRRHQHRVDPVEHLAEVRGGPLHRRVVRHRLLEPASVAVDDDADVGHRGQHADVLAPPVPVAHDCHTGLNLLRHWSPMTLRCSDSFSPPHRRRSAPQRRRRAVLALLAPLCGAAAGTTG